MRQAGSSTKLAVLSATVIGFVNIASMGAVYTVFSSTHTAPESEFAKAENAQTTSTDSRQKASEKSTTSQKNTDSTEDEQKDESDDVTSESGQAAADADSDNSGQASSPTSTTTGSTGSASGSTGSAQTTPSTSGSSTKPTPSAPAASTPTPAPAAPAPPAEPVSLKKGSPCQTQTPPAGVCSSVLSFNNQKIGNSNWDATTMAAIKQGVADNDFVKLFHLNATDIFNSMQITLTENTWNGNATHGTIGGKMGASGQSEATTFTLDWNGSKWIVNGVAQN